MQGIKNKTLIILGIGVALIQVFDIVIHAATNQLEFLRVMSNVIILIWLAVTAWGKGAAQFLHTAIGSIGLYLFLNILFLAREGLTNPDQGGDLRTTLFMLVLLTVLLSFFLTYKYNHESSRQ